MKNEIFGSFENWDLRVLRDAPADEDEDDEDVDEISSDEDDEGDDDLPPTSDEDHNPQEWEEP